VGIFGYTHVSVEATQLEHMTYFDQDCLHGLETMLPHCGQILTLTLGTHLDRASTLAAKATLSAVYQLKQPHSSSLESPPHIIDKMPDLPPSATFVKQCINSTRLTRVQMHINLLKIHQRNKRREYPTMNPVLA
jgi:hypothetical protein